MAIPGRLAFFFFLRETEEELIWDREKVGGGTGKSGDRGNWSRCNL